MAKEYLYTVLYSDCIYESAYAVHSLHRTKKGAAKAMAQLKKDILYEYFIMPIYVGFRYGRQEILD